MGCCGGSTLDEEKNANPRVLKLHFLFLDESICKPCGGTGHALDEAAETLAAPLAAMGATLAVERPHVTTREEAIAHELVTSPTIRVNGVDIDPDQTQGECGSCGDLSGGQTTINCRTWHWKGEVYSSAPTGKIVEAIMAAAIGVDLGASDCCSGSCETFVLPQNLENFFQARQSGDQCCC